MSFETLLQVVVCVLIGIVVAGGLMGARLMVRVRARSRQINAQMVELDQRLDRVDGFQETLQGLNERLRADLSALAGRLDERFDEAEKVNVERYESVLRELAGMHRELDRLDHLAQHRAALDRAAAAVAHAVEHGPLAGDSGSRLLHHLAEARSALDNQDQDASPEGTAAEAESP